ncbi:hypothetical protein RDWZM_010285 [Blomia tropicalis]|uniref:Fibronectin type-III domain-containing protein n=1 Tax=Blomia tropicalis TaxID=40697 RepID=A0A9Q0RIW7_BLOTA|nr:hypothetical protein RDWZM_010285 [Blomia tropicalis]
MLIRFMWNIRSMLGTPSAPSVVSGSITNQSLTIEWKPIVLTNITHRIQWKYANVSSTWSYTTPDATEPNGPNRVHLHNLYAYSSYQFRIEWLIVPWLRISIYSKPSEPITTLQYGVPSTPCIITTFLPISSSQISVNWRQPDLIIVLMVMIMMISIHIR